MRLHVPLRLLCTLSAATLLVGCGFFAYQEESYTLETTTWRIVQVDGVDVPRGGQRDLAPHFVFDTGDGRSHGATGCNRFSASYRATGSELAFAEIVTTEVACADEVRARVEAELLETLPEVTSYRIQGDKLWLYGGATMRIAAERW